MSREELVSPGCPRGCSTCFRDCAVVTIKLGWWQGELQRLLALKRPRDRFARQERHKAIEEAQGSVMRLTARRNEAWAFNPASPMHRKPELRLIVSEGSLA